MTGAAVSPAHLAWAGCAAVGQGSLRLSGAWVFRDTRIPVAEWWGMPPEARLQPWPEADFC